MRREEIRLSLASNIRQLKAAAESASETKPPDFAGFRAPGAKFHDRNAGQMISLAHVMTSGSNLPL
jgi:hypothetical protein